MPEAHGLALCVFCRQRPVDVAWRPFCSERCKTRDLAGWADGTYRVPGVRTEQSENSESGDKGDKKDADE